MKSVENVVVTDRAVAIFQREMAMRRPGQGQVIALHFMPSFTNADGTTVDEFVPGYAIDYVADRDFGALWLMARLPGGASFRFMPKFEWQADGRYVVDRASAYTLSIGPASMS